MQRLAVTISMNFAVETSNSGRPCRELSAEPSMYKIELRPDDIGVFRSIEEMAQGIRSGVITSRCRIYHQASDKWLPIEFHPHYKRALELSSAAPTAPTPSAPPSPAPPGIDGPVLTATAASGVAVADEDEEEEE